MVPPFSSQSLSYPYVTIFCSVLLVLYQPASICIIIIPNSLTFHLFFFLFSSIPNIYFSLLSVLKLHTSLHDTPYPFLVSPLTTPPFSCYDPLLIHLCALDISYAHLVSKLSPHFTNSLYTLCSLYTVSFSYSEIVFTFLFSPRSRYPHLLQMYH